MSPAERIAKSRMARLDEGLSTWQALGRDDVAWAALDGARDALTAWRVALGPDADLAEAERWQASEAAWERAEARLLGLASDESEAVRVSLDGAALGLAGGAEGVRARVAAACAKAPRIVARRAA